MYRENPDLGDKGGGSLLEQVATRRQTDYPEMTKPYKELERMCR